MSFRSGQKCPVCGHPIFADQEKATHNVNGNHDRGPYKEFAHLDCAERAGGIASGYWMKQEVPVQGIIS